MNRITIFLLLAMAVSCSDNKLDKKGFAVTNSASETDSDKKINGLTTDSMTFETKPSSILLTGFNEYRLTTIFKVNYSNKRKTPFIGSNAYFRIYRNNEIGVNNWNSNFLPGLEAVYGYNMVNVSINNLNAKTQKLLFKHPVLIKTLYFPTNEKDTLNSEPVQRNYLMVSMYNQDSNSDGFINALDLRRLYAYTLEGVLIKPLIPENYSAVKAEYDSVNDLMYVFAQLDENNNGQIDEKETTHIFWIDLKDPNNTGRFY